MITIGVDTHKRRRVAVGIASSGHEIGSWRGPNSAEGWDRLREWALSLGEARAWGVEGSGGGFKRSTQHRRSEPTARRRIVILVWMSTGSCWGCSGRVDVAGGLAGGRAGPGLVDTTRMSHSPGVGGTLVGSHTVAGPMMSAGSGSAGHSLHDPWRGVSRFDRARLRPRRFSRVGGGV